MISIQRFFLSIFFLAFAGTCLAVPAGVNWQWANPTPQGNPFNAVAYNSGLGVTAVVGDLGNIISSTDGGVNWTSQASGVVQNLNDIIKVGSLFYAVGDNGTILVYPGSSSPQWSSNISNTTANLNGISWSSTSGTGVAVGDNGTIVTKVFASSWVTQTPFTGAGNLTDVAWSASLDRFVTVTDNGKIFASDDSGATWSFSAYDSASSLTLPIVSSGFNAVIWDNTDSLFVAVGRSGDIFTSANGLVWTKQTSGTTLDLLSITSSGSKYIVTSASSEIFTSSNATAWATAPSGTTGVPFSISLFSVTWDGSQFVLAGSGATLLTSPAGTTWTRRYPVTLTDSDLSSVVWSSTLSKYLASGDGLLLTSLDGQSWALTNAPVLNGLADNGALVVGVSPSGNVYSSLNGVDWTLHSTGSTNYLNTIIWNGSQFVAVGVAGTVVTSTDGVAWTVQTSGVTDDLLNVAWDGSQFVAVGANGVVLSSPDAMNWTSQSSGVTTFLRSVTWGLGQFVAVGSSGKILTSPDAVTWTAQISGITYIELNDIVWNDGQFTAVGDHGTILSSTDGVIWKNQSTGSTDAFFAAVTGNNSQTIAVGWGGTILNGIASYTIGGSVTGLNGALVLKNNGGDDLTVSAAGSFSFATPLTQGATYDVTMLTSPSGQTCSVVSGSGAVNGANVTSVSINCTDNPVSTTSTTPTPVASGGGGGVFNFYLLMLLPGLLIVLRRRNNMPLRFSGVSLN